jgi:HSP20 family protein
LSRSMKRNPSPGEEAPQGPFAIGRVMLVDISGEAAYRPPADIHETPEGVVIRVEIPGVAKGEVDVRVKGARIEIVGEKQPDPAGEDASYLCLERAFGKFHRAFDVSGSVNLSRMTAVLKGGVLILFLPKVLERRGREQRIPIHEEE